MFEVQSIDWSWRERLRTMIQSTPQNQPWSASRERMKVLECPPQWKSVNRSETCHTCKAAKYFFWTRGVLPEKMGENSESNNWKTLGWQQGLFTSCYSCPRRSYKVLIDRAPKLLLRAFFLFYAYRTGYWYWPTVYKNKNIYYIAISCVATRFNQRHWHLRNLLKFLTLLLYLREIWQ